MYIHHFYAEKKILITGGTGFLGKLLVEKILFSFPNISQIYLIIRQKKGKTPFERFQSDVLQSKCFDRLRGLYKDNFTKFIANKITVFAGDVEQQKLGLSSQDYNTIAKDCQIVFANAAKIKFDDHLDLQMKANIESTLSALQLAQKANVQIFVYTSTFGVTHHRQSGYIEQKMYDLTDNQGNIVDCGKLYEELKAMDVEILRSKTKQILKKYSQVNQYSFTKYLSERMVELKRGVTPISIIRPTMVYCTYKQPFPGWIDVLHAGQITFLFVGLGLLQQFMIDPYLQVDTVPADIVINNMIVSSCYHAGINALTIYHVASVERNPILWKQMIYITVQFWKAYPTPKRLATPAALISKNQLQIKLHFLRRQILIWLYVNFIPIFKPSKKQGMKRLSRLNQKAIKLSKMYRYGFDNFWVYETKRVDYLKQWLKFDSKQFLLDCADINMLYYFLLNNYGIKKFILKQEIEELPRIILQSDRIELKPAAKL